MSRAAVYAALVALVALALPGARVAAEDVPEAFGEGDTFHWPGAEDDEARAEYERQMAIGDRFALAALEAGRRTRDNLFERALRAYENASKALPGEGEPHWRAAHMIFQRYLAERPGSDRAFNRPRARQVIEHWNQFETKEPLDPRATDLLFRRAIQHTKLAGKQDLENAIRDYETLIERTDLSTINTDEAAIRLGNLAETYMMLGRIDEAIPLYERSIEFSPRQSHFFGLAVALDRDGQGAKAREVMHPYASGGGMRHFEASLGRGEIFFVPDGEQYYYLALGYESAGHIDRAIEHYERFLDSGAHPQFQPRARENLAVLRAAKKSRRLP